MSNKDSVISRQETPILGGANSRSIQPKQADKSDKSLSNWFGRRSRPG